MSGRRQIDLERRRQEHIERVAEWRKLSPTAQLASLAARMGESKRQVMRITKKIQVQ